MKKVLIIVGTVFLVMVILAVVGSVLCVQSCTKDKNNAEEVLSGYYQAVGNNDIDLALSFFSDEFFQLTPREEWKETLISIRDQMGVLEDWNQQSWHINKSSSDFSCEETTTELEFEYETVYANGNAIETFTVIKLPGESEYAIFGHSIDTSE